MATERIDSFAIAGYQLSLTLTSIGAENHSAMSELPEQAKEALREILVSALRECVKSILPIMPYDPRADHHSRSIQDRMSE